MRFHSRLDVWFLAIAGIPAILRAQSPAPPILGAAASFAVLGGSSVTSSGSTIITGNLGVSPGNTITGSPTVKIGATYRNDSVARQAQRDATSAYNDLAGRICDRDLSGQDLGGKTLDPGVYCFSLSAQLTGTPLILRASPNHPNAPWIFKIKNSLTTNPGSSVLVINGGHESNIFWQVGDSVTLGAGTAFLGNTLALKDITLGSGASVSGRLLAQGAVSLAGNNASLCCDPITLSMQTLPNGIAGVAYSQTTITASGGVGTYAFSVSSGKLPDGLSLNNPSLGVVSGTPTKTGTFTFTITVTDSRGCTGTQAYTIVISCLITVNNPNTNMGTVNVAFSQTFTATNAVGTTTFTLNNGTLPTGLTLSTAGVLSGTPKQTGTFPITVHVIDHSGCSADGATYNLTIGCQTIAVNNPAITTGTVNIAFGQTFTATNTIGTVNFTTASTLPTGLTLSSAGVLSGTSTQKGSFPIVVTATDTNDCTGTSTTYNLVISCQVISVSNPPANTGTANIVFSQTFTATNTIGTVNFTTASNLPTGLLLSAGGVLGGTPMQTGSFPIVVTATDANGCAGSGSTYTLTINAVACILTLSPSALPSPSPGDPYNEVITASGGTAPYTFTITGSLPPGLSSTTTATTLTISGIPTTAGCFPFTVTVTDANGCSTSITYTICVAVGGPTLSGWGIVVLSILLVGAAIVMMRRGGS